MHFTKKLPALVISSALLLLEALFGHGADNGLLNVSYDPTREFYAEYNTAFARYWKE